MSFFLAIVLTIFANVFNFIGFVSPFWIVSRDGDNYGFVRLGLWEVCFKNFIFAEDYISKAYDGCWYIYRQEFKYIRFWINPPWFIIIQITSIVNITFSLGGLILILQNAAGIETTFCTLSSSPIIFLQSVVVACLTVITIVLGLMSKDRQWLPFSDRNTVGWGLGFSATAGILTLLSIFCLLVDQLAHYSEQIYHKLLEEKGITTVHSIPPDIAPGHDNVPASGISQPGPVGTESRLGGVPSLFMTGSLPSVGGGAGGGPATRIFSVLGGAKSAILSKYGETRTTIPGLAMKPEAQTTSGALVSARLRENLQSERPIEPPTAQPAVGSIHSLNAPATGGLQERPVIVYGASRGNIIKDSAV
ncbi:unnamed protein product [Mesocestoides corti]|uniref:Uncharacterized protein n=1 Tax=Mesocestoides corti TaxID=53468 RepID=A0A3P6I387_MESCO|nr:unnamed protein product [Mesocestoides corti]